MIVVVEGIDRVGKTTLVNKLVAGGFIDMKDYFVINKADCIDNFADYSAGKCESFVIMAKQLSDKGMNVVIDRLHLTEMVYGTVNRCGNTNEMACLSVDLMLEEAGALLCLVEPGDIELSNKLAGVNQEKHAQLFDHYYNLTSITRKMCCDYENITKAANYILEYSNDYDLYFASPFFTPEQIEREERMISHLRQLGFTVFSPKENCNLGSKSSQEDRQKTFLENCQAIKKSRGVFAVTDGKDMGTIWEAGYAYGINKPVIYFAETLGDNQFNLMLAQSGKDVFVSQNEVSYGSIIDALIGFGRVFKGDIE